METRQLFRSRQVPSKPGQIRSIGKQQVDPKLSDTIAEYLLHHKAKGNTVSTIKRARWCLGMLMASIGEDAALNEIDASVLRRLLIEYQNSVNRYGRAPTMQSVAHFYDGLRAFLRWAVDEGLLEFSPLSRVTRPRCDRVLLQPLTPPELRQVEKVLTGTSLMDVRNRALFYLMLDSGMRRAEVANLKVEDVDSLTGMITVHLGKGRKDRLTRIGSVAQKALLKYLRMVKLAPSDPLWVGERGFMTSWGITRLFGKLSRLSGVQVHPHKLRRTCAISMLRNGVDVFSLQYLMGHSDLSTLRIYLNQTGADIELAHQRYGVLDNLKMNGRLRGR